jgi:ribosomal protein L40E
MNNCSNPICHANNPIDANYCHMCGQKLQRNRLKALIKGYEQEILCGLGVMGMIILIIAALGIAIITNAIIGSFALGLSILLLEIRTK